jgi:biopolymer transport protein ExbB/TolQ
MTAVIIAASGIEDVLFHIANALRIPVFIAAGVALAIVLFDLGAFFIELSRRGRRGRLEEVEMAAASAQMADTLIEIVEHHDRPGVADRRAKALADFDLTSLRKLERSRMLVRFGPALGLMGTLIPLSPALDGLAKGDVTQLSENLRVAFSVTVLGLLIGALAFTISLVRDRLYAQDLSDLEYVVSQLEPGTG